MNKTPTMPVRHQKTETRGSLRHLKKANVTNRIRSSNMGGKGKARAKRHTSGPLRVVRSLMWLWRLSFVAARAVLWFRSRKQEQASKPLNHLQLPATGGTLALGFAAGYATARIVRKEPGPPVMPHLDVWRKELIRQRGEIEGAMLTVRLQSRYNELYEHRPRFEEKALQRHLEQNILPGIALYGVLHQEHRDLKSTLESMDKLFQVGFTENRQLVSMLNRVPAPFFMLRKAVQRQLKRNFPPQGWSIYVEEDNDRVFDFHVSSCFYLNVLRAYGVPELTSLYCKNDDLLFSNLPTSIIWERTRTLGRGDALCDFRWCNAASKAITHYETPVTNTHPAPPVPAK